MSIFQRCKLAWLSGGMGAHCLGIEATELHSVLTMSREPAHRWPALSRQVLEMGSAAAAYINEQAAKEAKQRESSKR